MNKKEATELASELRHCNAQGTPVLYAKPILFKEDMWNPIYAVEFHDDSRFQDGRRTEVVLETSLVKDCWKTFRQGSAVPAVPQLGAKVRFQSNSSPTGYRVGRCLSVGPKRVTIGFTFKNGRESEVSVPIEECDF